MAPQISPARMPARAMAPSMMGAGVAFGSRKTATPVAAQAPMNICPSAPMFHNRMRKATMQARPVSRMGEVFTSVSDSGPKHSNPLGQSPPLNKAPRPACQSAGVPKPSLKISW